MKHLAKIDLSNLARQHDIDIKNILLIVSMIFDEEYVKVFFQNDFCFSAEQYIFFTQSIERLAAKEPVAKIVQKKEFYSIEYKTTSNTLDPRPETELVIDLFQKYFPQKGMSLEILDLGCGTGCVGLSILKFYPSAICDFADISEEALDVCQENATKLDLSKRAMFTKSNWLGNIFKKYDAIVCNPPYIDHHYPLDKDVLYDPAIALFAGEDGMEAYQKILPNVANHLKNKKILILEIGYDQKEKVASLRGNLKILEIAKDTNNINRTFVFQGS